MWSHTTTPTPKRGCPSPQVRGNSAPEQAEHNPSQRFEYKPGRKWELIDGEGGQERRQTQPGSACRDLSGPSSQSKRAVVFCTALNTEIFREGGERGISPPSKQVEDLQRLGSRWRCVSTRVMVDRKAALFCMKKAVKLVQISAMAKGTGGESCQGPSPVSKSQLSHTQALG